MAGAYVVCLDLNNQNANAAQRNNLVSESLLPCLFPFNASLVRVKFREIAPSIGFW